MFPQFSPSLFLKAALIVGVGGPTFRNDVLLINGSGIGFEKSSLNSSIYRSYSVHRAHAGTERRRGVATHRNPLLKKRP